MYHIDSGGDKVLFEELYEENYKIVYGYLFSLSKNKTISEDLTSETFLKAFAKISTFKGDSKISTWLCQIAKNEYLQYLRKQKKSEPIEEYTDIEAPERIEDIVQDKSITITIHKLLHNLEEPYKEVFILKVFAELSYKDIACVLNKTETWARVTYYRARIKIIERLGDTNEK